jgi:hypothetical protein
MRFELAVELVDDVRRKMGPEDARKRLVACVVGSAS